MSKVKMILKPQCIYIKPNTMTKMFGFKWKIHRLEIEPSEMKRKFVDQSEYLFLDGPKSENSLVKNYYDIDINKIKIGEVKEQEKKGQYKADKIGYGELDTPLLIETPDIEVSMYGPPSKNNEWIKDDLQRTKLKTPLDPDNEQISAFMDMMNNIDDNIFENKAEIFGAKLSSKFKNADCHNRTIRPGSNSNEDDSSDDGDTPSYLPYMNAKFGLEWDSSGKMTGAIKTGVFKKTEDEFEKQSMDEIDKLDELRIYRSTIKMIISP